MPDGVHASMDGMKIAARHTSHDRRGREACADELIPRDDAMLMPRELRYDRIKHRRSGSVAGSLGHDPANPASPPAAPSKSQLSPLFGANCDFVAGGGGSRRCHCVRYHRASYLPQTVGRAAGP